ncbi:recombinase family protein [Sphingosinicella rhizophila]|uniref:Recombinase family protein n=1 Tax=Sphingosinicella rhizophila TaxID=3050082 RepID=A0ABU3Q3D0_9SPHN|nr:recombinase family protein [Sphingosinicella sp. GR2756]MDT9597921.1 recombinase family protein [Sphingosinicella sp. GR2756]
MTAARKVVRCAIYTRKSTEDGLDQEFNSLDAQRAACEAYVASQIGEGWELLPSDYDDGGFSGGNMERPGLQRLLAEVDDGNVDVIVVYKVDRLTRSLPDFARIIEKLDAAKASFVSVTQAFNTTSSMGRLTLNVLLSFAQFEREVTGERIRDKIAASKARGMWMGGNPALGYDIQERRLIINEREAAIVRHIFDRYLELGSVPRLVRELDEAGIRSKSWITADGKRMDGARLRPGSICYMLNNRLYLGEIVHKGLRHPGDHEAIVSLNIFEAVQRRLEENRIQKRGTKVRAATCWLTGKIADISGQPMRPSFSYGAAGRPYRYYVSEGELPGSRPGTNAHVTRVSAAHIERIVAQRVAGLIDSAEHDLERIAAAIDRVEIGRRNIHVLLHSEAVREPCESAARAVERLLPSIIFGDNIVLEHDERIRLVAEVNPVARGKVIKQDGISLEQVNGSGADRRDLASILRHAHARLRELDASPLAPETQGLAKAPKEGWTRNHLALGFIAPDIQKAMLKEKLDQSTISALMASIPLSWEDQRMQIQGFFP